MLRIAGREPGQEACRGRLSEAACPGAKREDKFRRGGSDTTFSVRAVWAESETQPSRSRVACGLRRVKV